MTEALENTEQARNAAQMILDARRSAQERNRLGQFATPTELALQLAALAKEHLAAHRSVRFMDPALGTGVFFYAASEVLEGRIDAAWGYETDPVVAEKAQELWSPFGLDVRLQDFCAATPPEEDAWKANLVLCNPPYVRHHHLSAGQKDRLRAAIEKTGYSLSGLSGLYCYFLLLANRWLSRDGIGVWLLPAEFLDVNYGNSIKEYLTRDVTLLRLHRFDPEEVQFTDALVSSVIVLFQKRKPSGRDQVCLTTGSNLSAPQPVRTTPLRDLIPSSKWGLLFTGEGVPSGGSRKRLVLAVGDLFNAKRGLATGANAFFIMGRRRAESLNLPAQYLRPILPSPRDIPGDTIEADDAGLPNGVPELVLIDCDLAIDQVREQAPTLFKYLELGGRQGIPDRYLPAHRRPWYSQEARPPAPILCTYMGRQSGGRALRFLRNKSAATAANVYLLLYPKPWLANLLKADRGLIERLFEALTESAAMLARWGRVYGGGLNKIEPKELEAVHLPQWLEMQYPQLSEFQLDGR